MGKFGKELIASMEEALQIVQGEKEPARVHTFDALDVRAARKKLGLSQPKFAELIGTPLPTLRKWEQRARRPSGAAATLLRVIEKEPEAVKRALAG